MLNISDEQISNVGNQENDMRLNDDLHIVNMRSRYV